MTLAAARKAYQSAKDRGDTRAMHAAEKAARKALHAVLAKPKPTLWQRLRGRV